MRISIDFDNVLFDLESLNCKKTKEWYGVDITPIEIKYWNYYPEHYPDIAKIWSDFSLYSEGSFFDNDQDFIEELRKKYEIQIVTASEKAIEEGKDEMIYKRYGDIKIVHTTVKYIHTEGSILIDDAVHNIKPHIEENKDPALLVDRGYGWNQGYNGVPRVSSFEEILSELSKF